MSTKKMLIDASHPEETRVAVLQNGKVEDFDFESLSRKPLRGNIYLARITRVEPSLQAAFVEYGGNRHGFLAFNEIHPDYYQIPVSDREVLRKAEALEAELAEALEALEAHEEGDVEPDLNEEDDGLRTVDAEVPDDSEVGESENGEHDEHETRRADAEAVALAAPGPDVFEGGADDEEADPREEEEEEEERDEAEEAGDADAGSDAQFGDTREGAAEDASDDEQRAGDAPADYAGEDTAEDAGWHAIEEEEIAALPKEEAERTPEADDESESQDKPEAEGSAGDAVAAAAAAETISADADADDDDDDADDKDDADADGETAGTTRRRRRRRGGRGRRKKADAKDEASGDEDETEDDAEADADAGDARGRADDDDDDGDDDDDDDDGADEGPRRRSRQRKASDPRQREIQELRRRYEEAKKERAKLLRNYRIQEVVKRRQIMLVQAVKEERGNKGAALTTYLSLAGRYGVLMPNTARGGGVSRKITNSSDRKRLRSAMSEMEIPQGQGLIIRTAGAKRTKAEIKRDYEYLSRLWETIREKTLKSVAPCLIYEEASLIKRAIRDLYDKDTETVLVEGEEGYREAKDFMKMIMPSHAKNVQPYKDRVPLFARHGVEQQIDEMFQPTVKLKSGGYLVIQQTEALVSVDVNSGRATKERNVEQTALKTNLEAAAEAARQCRLRDLAGLVVIDFIDMDERSNNRKVEKALKDAMKTDRARIQLGSISGFGLLEFSRQRRRAGIVDGTTKLCPLCEGAGAVRSDEMAAMRVLRAVEAEAIKGRVGQIAVTAAPSVALHVLNAKRAWLARIEGDYGVTVTVATDIHKNGDQFDMETSGEPSAPQTLRQEMREELKTLDDDRDDHDETADASDGADAADLDAADAATQDDDKDGESKPRRRRRGGRSRRSRDDEARSDDAEAAPRTASEKASGGASGDAGDTGDAAVGETPSAAEPNEANEAKGRADAEDGDDDDDKPKRRRRGRRGGRRNRKKEEDGESGEEDAEAPREGTTPETVANDDETSDQVTRETEPMTAASVSPSEPEAASTGDDAEDAEDAARKAAAADGPVLAEDGEAVTQSYTEVEPEQTEAETKVETEAGARSEAETGDDAADAQRSEAAPESAAPAKAPPEDIAPEGPKRGGWWQRALGR